jgi:lipopolysaccharide exporter
MNSTGNLMGRSLKAMSWSYSGVAISVLMQIAASILLARMLDAHITGVFAFGLLAFPPFRFLCEFGLGSALVEKPHLSNGDIQLAISRSAILALVTAVRTAVRTIWGVVALLATVGLGTRRMLRAFF